LREEATLSKKVHFQRTSPIMRIFDEAKATKFYLDLLGFELGV
jgi:hypothetical protein